MELAPIHKPSRPDHLPNVRDYDEERARFRWSDARAELAGMPGGGLNIAHEAIDRHAAGPLATKVALRWRGRRGERRDITYRELGAETARFANSLRALGVAPGEVVFTLCGRIPELFVAVFGALKLGCVVSPLFSAFGPDPIVTRVVAGRGRVLVTTATLYQRKIAPIRERLTSIAHVIVIDDGPPSSIAAGTQAGAQAGTLGWRALLDAASDQFTIAPTDPQTPALLHFTSGTTGRPKGALHVHEAVVAHHVTARMVLDLHPDDVFWCTADPGWVTGTSYGLIAPLTLGITSIVDEAEFLADRWYQLLAEEHVTVWYTAPTAIRMLMKAGPELPRRFDLSALRFAASVGEPLDPEAVVWGKEVLGLPFHDNWWQTETGGIMIANFACMDVRPGSMGKPLPGIEASIVDVTPDGNVTERAAGELGQLALRRGWPSMFRGYLDDEERYRRCFAGDWYLTGDLARRDPDGYFWFVGRADDVIKSSGHLIGPFEVESVLVAHPAVAQAAVIGIPHPVAGEIVKAFVVLRDGSQVAGAAGDALRDDVLGFARKHLGAAVAPREIAFVTDLPRTRSGKILRRLLRARELGLPEGDTSMLEGAP
ncbi:MAG: acetyl-CoA synthetase [Deltaproteobacteria bacterium]|nr:acetyl-CoA synthetase [Deltaproteobacteria bacterium]